MKTQLDVGIICDWLVTYAGSEKVVAEFIKLYPTAELYSVVDFLSDENRAHFNNKKLKQHLFKSYLKRKKNIKIIFL